MKKVLIITHSRENQCVEMVSRAIAARGGQAFRFNTDLYPSQIQLTLGHQSGSRTEKLVTPDFELDLSTIDSLWYRRNAVGKELMDIIENRQLLQPSIEESRRTFLGMMFCTHAFKLDPWVHLKHAENKQLQIQVGEELGLDVPATLITNSEEEVRAFQRQLGCDLITKMQTSFSIYSNGEEQVVFTNRLDAEALQDLDGLQYCPMIFQEYIEKRLELRVTIVGNRIFCAAVDSQQSEKAVHDWRKDGIGLINSWFPYELPVDVEEKLLSMMDIFQLNYGAIDMILTPDGRHVFIEINPAGEFYWLDDVFKHGISEAIADVLLGRCARRNEVSQFMTARTQV